MIKIALIDDHPIITDGLSKVFNDHAEFEVVGVYNSSVQASEELPNKVVDIILSDVSMPDMSGYQLIQKLKKAKSEPKVIMLSMFVEKSIIASCYQMGADGYISKSEATDKIIATIQDVLEGKKVFPYPTKELEASDKDNKGGMLSAREIEILKLVAEGLSSKHVADKLFLSELTVNTHRRNMLKKTNQPNVAALVNYAKQNQWIS
jgi:two-component system, NarL family, nitrate/nitrite response regulator NarL